jgi:maltose alpha-D-glucosyltransferase/alpha-amylase
MRAAPPKGIAPMSKSVPLESDPLWFKDAIVYEAHVRAFYDESGDGMGDFAGLTEKLDYLRDLGVTAIWLLPFCPSPWRDDGYDTSDYTAIHPAYGTLRDFQSFLREAHARGLRVITELVLNHTSDQHAWFQRSRRAPAGSRWRNFYVWSDSPELYRDARIIFKDFETSNWTWDPIAKAYYWHRFYSHQPDLNYESSEVRAAMFQAVDFWFDLGVDGLRLDAVPYLYEREGTNCENLPETHQFLKELRAHIDARHSGRMILAEANQWPEDAIAYFGGGDECHMAFHFPLMPRLFMATRMEDRYPVTDILGLTPAIPENCQWALFLRNHDELTLEMVTDEERDYMYRVYAQDRHTRINLGIRRRLAPLLENDRRRIELLNGLLCSLPGTPVIYYGDEIGMGDNIYLGDRNGVRTPMQWSGDRNAGFSRANPQSLYLPVNIDPEYHYEAINVETQQNNSHSLLWWMRRLLALRRKLHALGRGSLEFLYPDNRRILAFVRAFDGERVLVVANLSRFTQCVELDLAKYAGMAPIELFGRTEFPPVGDQPYFLSLGPHAFYWFSLQPKEVIEESLLARTGEPPSLAIVSWDAVFSPSVRAILSPMLPAYLRPRRWFRSRNRTIRLAEIHDVIPFPKSRSYVLIIRVDFTEGDPEYYTISVSVTIGEAAEPGFVMARLRGPDGSTGLLHSAFRNRLFSDELLAAILRRRRHSGEVGQLIATHTRQLRALMPPDLASLDISVAKVEQDNTTEFFGDRFALKVLRKIEEGPHPEEELVTFLNQADYPCVPPLCGAFQYLNPDGEPAIVALLFGFVRGAVEGWQYTLDHLGMFFENAIARSPEGPPQPAPEGLAQELIGSYLQWVRQLASRTGEMHATLASRPEDPVFGPEPFNDFYRHSLYHGMLGRVTRTLDQLKARLPRLPEAVSSDARELLDLQNRIRERFRFLRDQRISASRIRIHGDFHLGQVLYTGKDFVIIDFEGDPGRPLSERRIKRSPLQDVAGMIDSFYTASHGAVFGEAPGPILKPEHSGALAGWARYWALTVSRAFLESYLLTPGIAPLLPEDPQHLRMLIRLFVMDLAMRKLAFDLGHAADHIRMPCRLIIDLTEAA